MPDTAVTISIPEAQPTIASCGRCGLPSRRTATIRRYPLRPATRPLSLGIDVTTIPAPPTGTFATFLGRDELDIQLLVPKGTEVREAWAQALPDPLVRQIEFTLSQRHPVTSIPSSSG